MKIRTTLSSAMRIPTQPNTLSDASARVNVFSLLKKKYSETDTIHPLPNPSNQSLILCFISSINYAAKIAYKNVISKFSSNKLQENIKK